MRAKDDPERLRYHCEIALGVCRGPLFNVTENNEKMIKEEISMIYPAP